MELVLVLISLAILVFSAILHEIAHGFVADSFGDPTARLSGRLTLNPKSHIDPMMTIFLPLLLFFSGSPVIFGGAKPVPIDPYNFREGRKDLALVALAGPATNIILAVLATLIFRLLDSLPMITPAFVGWFLNTVVQINLLLAIFNLIPIPPLDGSKIVSLLLPEKDARAYLSVGNVGMIILFFLLFFPIGGFSLGDFISRLVSLSRSILLP